MNWNKYRRTNVAEMIPWTPDVDMRGVSISDADLASGSPKNGDMIARNPKSHADKWLIAADYFRDNFQPVSATETKLYAITEAEVGTLLALIERLDPRDDATADEWRMLRSLPELPAPAEPETNECEPDPECRGCGGAGTLENGAECECTIAEPETCECAEPEPREAYRWNMSVAYHECRKCGKRIKSGREQPFRSTPKG